MVEKKFDRSEIVSSKDVDDLLIDTCLAVVGAIDGCKDNRNLSEKEKACFLYDSYMQDLVMNGCDGLGIDKTSDSYVNSYNKFFDADVSTLIEIVEEFQADTQAKMEFLAEHFNGYEFCVNFDMRRYKLDSDKKIYYTEELLDKLVAGIQYCEHNKEEDRDFNK